MAYSAVPTTNYGDIPQPVPAFPPPEHTQYAHEKDQFLVHHHQHQYSQDAISDNEAQKPYGGNGREHSKSPFSTFKFVLVQIVAFLWIGPIVALLFFNLKEWVIGASAWCPFGHCRPYNYGGEPDTLILLAKFDHESHNLLGALQFAAKALEVWFVLVASALVFRLTMILVHMPDGLPLGYIFRPSEYAEVTSLLDRELYTTLFRMPSGSRKHVKKRIAAFIFLTMLLCIVCNLMGPALAVLLIPALQWIDTERVGNQTLDGLNSASPPGLTGFAFTDSVCDEESFSAQQYSCASYWSAGVDGWVQSYQSSERSLTSVFSVQDTLTISYNYTYPVFKDGTWDTMYFVPNRQVVQELANDSGRLVSIDDDQIGADVDGTYTEYTRTLQTYIHRQGPIVGGVVNLDVDYDDAHKYWVTVADQQYLRCYESYNISNVPLCWDDCWNTKEGNYTRCIQVGSAWPEEAKNATFTITPQWEQDQDSLNGSFGMTLVANIYTSPKVAFLPNGTLPEGFSEDCLPRGGVISTGTDCDWDAFFATGNDSNVARHSKHVTTWEIFTGSQNRAGMATNTTLTIDFSIFQAFADYSFDPSGYSNPMAAVDTAFVLEKDETFPNNITVLPVDPAWSLAAFGVDNGGVMTSNRATASWISSYINALAGAYQEDYPFKYQATFIEGATLMPVVQLMSLIDFNTTVVDTKTVKDDRAHPLLQRWGHINVWAYSTDSRTSKFGLVVVLLGCLVVLTKVAVSCMVRQEFPSPLNLLVAAMEHRYTGEFRGESDHAPIPFSLRPDEDTAGGYRFRKRD